MICSRKNKKEDSHNNRINFLIAIVFLFGILIILKLYNVQILKHQLYSEKASGQHYISNKLDPERGEIFMVDKNDNIYPFATNKNFALIYAIPSEMEIEKQEEIATKIFQIFDRENIVKEVDEYFEEKDKQELKLELGLVANWEDEDRTRKEAEIKYNFNSLRSDSIWCELREEKKDDEIKKREKEIVKKYLKKIGKRNDPYEPIEKKVSKETLKELYSLLLSSENTKISTSSIVIKDSVVYKKLAENDELEKIKIKGIAHIMKKYRYYPEGRIGSHLMGFVNEVEKGNYGLEGFFNEELFGQSGSVKSEIGADRKIIILNNREYEKPEDGVNLVLSIDRSIQFFACNELKKSIEKHDADKGSVIVMNPKTGAITAMCSFPNFDPNNYGSVEDISVYNNPSVWGQYEPGSVFKAITIAAAIDNGSISPDTLFNDKGNIMIEGWNKPIRNSDFETRGGHGMVDMNYVLVHSLNTGSIFAMNKMGVDVFSKYVQDFGFGERTGIELGAESKGDIKSLLAKKIKPIDSATNSFGQGITVTPLQMISAYAAIANKGILMKPFIVQKIINDDKLVEETRPVQIRSVIAERTANFISSMLANVVEEGHAEKASVNGYFIAGKTGTAQVASKIKSGYSDDIFIHNFIGFAPVHDPSFVMLVKLDNPKDVPYSSDSAAPLFGTIAEFILKYYEIPKER